jgi:hypothetical protein
MSPHYSVGRYVGRQTTRVNWGSIQSSGAFNQAISVFFYNREKGPLRMIEAVPLPPYGKRRHMPPRDLERTPCRHLGGAESQ